MAMAVTVEQLLMLLWRHGVVAVALIRLLIRVLAAFCFAYMLAMSVANHGYVQQRAAFVF